MAMLNQERMMAEWQQMKELAIEHKTKAFGVIAAVGVVVISFALLRSPGPDPYDRTTSCKTVGDPTTTTTTVPDSCPWQMVMSDVSHRVRLLEMAFKEQAKARELLSLELYNHTDNSEALQRRLEGFLVSLKHISNRIDRTNERMEQLSSRLYSDECLGFLILVCLAVQIILVLRAKFVQFKMANNGVNGVVSSSRSSPLAANQVTPGGDSPNTSTNNNSGSVTPNNEKKNHSRAETCIVLFNNFKPSQQQLSPLLGACSKVAEGEGSKLSLKSAYVVNSQESLQRCPTSKLYIVVIPSHLGFSGKGKSNEGKEIKTTSSASPTISRPQHLLATGQQQQTSISEVELLLSFVRASRANGAQILLIILNDESSAKLSSNSLYNPNHPLIQQASDLQDLAFNGRICTVWQEFSPFQLNHAKKVYKNLQSHPHTNSK